MAALIGLVLVILLFRHLDFKKSRSNAADLIQRGLCPPCNGSGEVTIYRSETSRQSVNCDGFNCSNGRRAGDRDMPCYTCGGSGKVMRDVTIQVPIGTEKCQTCHGDGKYVPGSMTISAPGLLDRLFDFLWAVICLGGVIFGFCCVFGIIGAIWQTALGQGTSAKDSIGDRVGLFVVLSGFLIIIFFIERWVWRHFKRFIRDAFT